MVANPLCVRKARGGVFIGLVRRMVTVAVVGAALITSAGPAGAQTAAGDAEAAFLARITAARQAQGLPALPVEGDLASVARAHSADMAAVSRLFHNDALGQQVTQWISVGENVGAGTTVDQIHQTLMASAIHRGDILSTRYTGVGIGVVQSGGTLWVTQVFRQKAGAAAPEPAPPPPPPTSPPVTEPPVPVPVEVTPVTAPPTTAAPVRPRSVAAPARPKPAPTTVPPPSTTVAPPTTEPPALEFAPAAAPAPAVVGLAGPAAEVNLGPVAKAAAEPLTARPELVAAGLVAIALLWLVGFRTARLAIARRRPVYLHRIR